jgi:hypothetical protein
MLLVTIIGKKKLLPQIVIQSWKESKNHGCCFQEEEEEKKKKRRRREEEEKCSSLDQHE